MLHHGVRSTPYKLSYHLLGLLPPEEYIYGHQHSVLLALSDEATSTTLELCVHTVQGYQGTEYSVRTSRLHLLFAP